MAKKLHSMNPNGTAVDLETALAALRRDYSRLAPRIKTLEHSVGCDCEGVKIHLHFPAIRQGNATVYELVEAISLFLTPFALPRSEIKAVDDLYGKVDVNDFKLKFEQLSGKARDLFKRANEATNRNGEAGELLLYLLTEWVLDAPQLIAKMSLKTNRDMPVHGADGVHVRYSSEHSSLVFYWGESKLYADVGAAIKSAIASICESLEPEKMKHEINLVQRNIDFACLDKEAKDKLLQFLDPFDDCYNNRLDVITCLIGFNYNAFSSIISSKTARDESLFIKLAEATLRELAPELSSSLKAANLSDRLIEIFFFPVPSVQELRDLFQEKIGWKK